VLSRDDLQPSANPERASPKFIATRHHRQPHHIAQPTISPAHLLSRAYDRLHTTRPTMVEVQSPAAAQTTDTSTQDALAPTPADTSLEQATSTDLAPIVTEQTIITTNAEGKKIKKIIRRKRRPARPQVDPATFKTEAPPPTGTTFNIWYNKWSGGDRGEFARCLLVEAR
jgi:hypothetical protein